MKLPNGFGTIVKYTDKPRRRPYVAKKTIDGRQRQDETAVKHILGHASQGVTKSVYTHKSLHELKRAIDLL